MSAVVWETVEEVQVYLKDFSPVVLGFHGA